MESANLHNQHQVPDHHQLVGSSSTSPSFYGASNTLSWTPNISLNNVDFNPICNGLLLNSRQKNDHLNPLNSSMIQDLGSHWTTNAKNLTSQASHDWQFMRTKEDLSASDSSPKFTELLNSPSISEDSSQTIPLSYFLTDDQSHDMNDLSEKLLLKTISSSFHSNAHQFSSGQYCSRFGSAMPNRGSFSQIYPSVNVSNLNAPSQISNSFDMNLEALDLMSSARFSGSFSQPSHDHLGLYKERLPFATFDQMQQSSELRSSCSPTKMSLFNNEATEAKRPNTLMEPKATSTTTTPTTRALPKKSRLESRASCPPFKVRKEKLGDRIAALQQLVAPFGKTDTASVLMEAIGYIKFLQNQVETLSVPYMKSSRDRTNTRTIQGGSRAEDGSEEPKRDLRSRGLCLVPLSCMSYVTSDTGGCGIWPPPNFGGGT